MDSDDKGKLEINQQCVYESHGQGKSIIKTGWPKGTPMENVGKGSGTVDAGQNLRGNLGGGKGA